jgi:hypothetical protein
VSDKSSDFNSLIQCGLGTALLTLTKNLPAFSSQETSVFKFNITHDQIADLLKDGVQTYFMGIVMTITFKEENISRRLKYIYETLEVSLVSPSLSSG